MKPRLLDLFCGAGGAAVGYHRAGFEVIGIDIRPQPHYPFEFHQGDALTWSLDGFDAIHASPPCQGFARVTEWRGSRNHWPDLLTPTLDRLRAQSTPWVVENVPEAIRYPDWILCGSAFGLPVRRHRHFLMEPPSFALLPPCRHHELRPFMHKHERAYADALGCGWMTSREAREAIPPAYTEWIGARLLEVTSPACGARSGSGSEPASAPSAWSCSWP